MDDERKSLVPQILEDVFAALVRLLLAGLFLYSGIPKINDPIGFIIKIDEYNVLPPQFVEPFGIYLPWVMVVSSVLLIIGLGARGAAGAISMMLISFLFAIGINIYRETAGLPCGCFGDESGDVGWVLFFQDVGLLLLSFYVIIRGCGKFGLDRFVKNKYLYIKNN
jgi:uncharacterized membrane protein YphA (DoxX/SURF4 family)